jgi:hypothetical protein
LATYKHHSLHPAQAWLKNIGLKKAPKVDRFDGVRFSQETLHGTTSNEGLSRVLERMAMAEHFKTIPSLDSVLGQGNYPRKTVFQANIKN